jgi:O-Antigen ligase
VIAAAGPDAFHGWPSGWLRALFAPVLGRVELTAPVAVTNTWFIVGYNGLADLCLVAIFASAGVLLLRPGRVGAALCLVGLGASLVLLLGTDARGALAGLVVGVWAVGMVVWRRGWLLVLLVVPLAVAVAALGAKSLDVSSVAGRASYWGDLARLLVEYPLTGVGLGVDTANAVTQLYEVNPDPERIAYAHDTFVEAYLEQGPLGALGMLAIPALGSLAALAARRDCPRARRGLLAAGVGLLAALEMHGLTDQVVTTNVGTLLVLLSLAAVLASLEPGPLLATRSAARRLGLATLVAGAVALVAMLALPAGRATALLDLGGLRLLQAWAVKMPADQRAAAYASSEALLARALEQAPGHPAVLRDLARARAGRYDDSGALAALDQAAAAPNLDAFDMLQIGHLYRDLGFANAGYTWAARAYDAWGRPQTDTDPVLLVYKRETLHDNPNAQTLAAQGEAAMTARDFAAASVLFEQALTFQPDNAYLQDRAAAARRGVDKYGR